MEKVAVLPVPDWACAMTSEPVIFCQCLSNVWESLRVRTLNDGDDGALLDRRGTFEAVRIDT
jgi:hypothetical protein